MNKVERFRKDLEAERNAVPMTMPVVPVDPLAQAHASIRMDGRTGRAFTAVKNIIADPDQPRKAQSMDVAEIGQLGGSLKEKQLQPVVVFWRADLSKWQLICGERRWLATIAAGLDMIACVFHFKEPTPGERLKMQMGENLHRKDFSDLERAEGFRRLMELNGWTQKQLAREMHVSESTVTRALQLLELPVAIQADVIAGKISPKAAVAELHGATENELHGATENELPGATENELRGATRKRKKRGGGPKPGKVHTFKTTNGCKLTLAFKQRPTDLEIGQALREALEQHERKTRAA